jgi:hypothetical protein
MQKVLADTISSAPGMFRNLMISSESYGISESIPAHGIVVKGNFDCTMDLFFTQLMLQRTRG